MKVVYWKEGILILSPIILVLLYGLIFTDEFFFFGTSLLFLLIGGFFFITRWIKLAALQEAETINQILTQKRHDWLNHIQILMGYHMMNKPDQISNYLKRLVDTAERERNLSAVRYDPLAVFLLTLNYTYKQCNWRFCIAKPLQLPKLQYERDILQIIQQVTIWIRDQVENRADWNYVLVNIQQKPEQLLLSFEMKGEDDGSVQLVYLEKSWVKLRKKLLHWHGMATLSPEDKAIQIEYRW